MNKFIFLCFSLLSINFYSQEQEQRAEIKDFITEHEGLDKKNESGEINPINDREINKKIRFFIEEKFVNVEYTRNIIWDNYQTFISPYDRYHYHSFIVQVKVQGHERLKYLEVTYYPRTEKVESGFEWDDNTMEFEDKTEVKEVEAINS